ncbi:hypothetical protein [Curtobacterium sp. UCD-KPL2560]|nr:hypothetical protein [Curtobacterium sp. UCD-KPL2560]
MILGIGSTVTYQERVWTVVATSAHSRFLQSLDGCCSTRVNVDRLVAAP